MRAGQDSGCERLNPAAGIFLEKSFIGFDRRESLPYRAKFGAATGGRDPAVPRRCTSIVPE
jgi:hypothetical protein